MKATEQYFPAVLFIMLYKVALTFESVDEILKKTVKMKAVSCDVLMPRTRSLYMLFGLFPFPQQRLKYSLYRGRVLIFKLYQPLLRFG